MAKTGLTLRINWSNGRALGPGKIRLLQEIDKCGSISQAGRNLGISYHRAWLLINDMNNCFFRPVIETQTGGPDGGGALLTALGRRLIKRFQAIETEALRVTQKLLDDLEGDLKRPQKSGLRKAICRRLVTEAVRR